MFVCHPETGIRIPVLSDEYKELLEGKVLTGNEVQKEFPKLMIGNSKFKGGNMGMKKNKIINNLKDIQKRLV